MANLKYAVHEIHLAGNLVVLNEVFEVPDADLEFLTETGAVRDATEEELALYKLTKGKVADEAEKPADKPVAAKGAAQKPAAAAKGAAEKADDFDDQ